MLKLEYKTTTLARTLWLLLVIGIFLAGLFGRKFQESYPALIPWIPGLVSTVFLGILAISWKKNCLSSAFLLVILLSLGGLVAELFVNFPVERVHYFKYSTLAVLSFFSVKLPVGLKRAALALFAAALIGLAEEAAQLGIPARFFDWRDIGLNLFGAAWGTACAWKAATKSSR